MKFITIAVFAIIASLTCAEYEDRIVKALRRTISIGPNSFQHSHQLPNGIESKATYETKYVGDKAVTVQKGHYQHIAPNGITYIVSYYADETGFHPTLYEYNPAHEINNYRPKNSQTKK